MDNENGDLKNGFWLFIDEKEKCSTYIRIQSIDEIIMSRNPESFRIRLTNGSYHAIKQDAVDRLFSRLEIHDSGTGA